MSSEEIIKEVERLFPKTYLVGGMVRDVVMKKESNDLDFATALTPDEVESILHSNNKKVITLGKRFGTIMTKFDGVQVEITTFRGETYAPGNRKPVVTFSTDLNYDLSRRDFTMNAMAMREGRLIDPFKGKHDIELGLIRCVGKPTVRFKEDPLRMLRACRFASQLGFKIEGNTAKKIREHAHRILEVSKERWTQEIDKLLMGPGVELGLFYMWELGLFKFMIPGLHFQYGCK